MKKLEYLSHSDTLFLDAESEVNAMHVSACLILDANPLAKRGGGLNFARILGFIEKRVLLHPRYRQRVSTTPIEGKPVWVDVAELDLEYHVRYEALPRGSGEPALQDRCAEFAAEPLDPAKPLWAIRVLDGFAEDRFAIAVKAHHCLVDGVAGIQLLQSLLAHKPRKRVNRPRRSGSPHAPRWDQLLSGEIHDRVLDARALLGRVARSAREPLTSAGQAAGNAFEIVRVLATRLTPAASRTPLDTTTQSAVRSLEWSKTDIARISDIRTRKGGTLNDVVIATVSLALSRLLESFGISRAQQKEMEIRIAVPVDMRGEPDPSELGNRISMIFARIPVGEDDPLATLDQTRESLVSAKESGLARSLESLLDLSDWTPRFATRQLTRWAIASHPANLVLTNVRGPDQPLYLLESRLLDVYPIVPLMPGQTLAIAVLSYAGTLYWGFHADRENFHNLADWSKYTEEAFEDLYSAAMTR